MWKVYKAELKASYTGRGQDALSEREGGTVVSSHASVSIASSLDGWRTSKLRQSPQAMVIPNLHSTSPLAH